MPAFEPSIGLEVHAELNTITKVFCGCSTAVGAPPNSQVCPVCLGFPGVLPVLNRKVVESGLKLALALNCEITRPSIFERKGYYYPDLPKNFQISQKRAPLGRNGYIDLAVNSHSARVRISDVHIEEDAAKLLHPGDNPDETLVDFNRSGIPLLEIVSEPDMHSVAEAEAYMSAIHSALLYLGISEARMEQGQVRFEASISIRPVGVEELGTRVEIKNLNSFRAVAGAIDYEIKRQTRALQNDQTLDQETRLWDDDRQVTEPMRRKETAMDYRYFPEPDLAPLVIDDEWVARVRAALPELAAARRKRFIEQYALSAYDARILTDDKALADFFEDTVKAGAPPKAAANWITVEFLRLLNDRHITVADAKISPKALADLISMVPGSAAFGVETKRADGGQDVTVFAPALGMTLSLHPPAVTISALAAKTVFAHLFEKGGAAADVVAHLGLAQISDEAQLAAAVDEVINENPDAVANFKAGNEKSIGFLVGQVMRKSGKRANPQLVNRLLRDRLQ